MRVAAADSKAPSNILPSFLAVALAVSLISSAASGSESHGSLWWEGAWEEGDGRFGAVRGRYLRRYPELASVVDESVMLAVSECGGKAMGENGVAWGCPLTLHPTTGHTVFDTQFLTDTKESSVIHALSSAALLYKIREACLNGRITACGCLPNEPTVINATHQLVNDCPDAERFARDLARKFTDKALLPPPPSQALHAAIVLHNNLLGRKNVIGREKVVCRCSGTGISGSCAYQMCWNSVHFPTVTGALRRAYDRAVQVKLGNEVNRRTGLPTLVPADDPFGVARKRHLVFSAAAAVAAGSWGPERGGGGGGGGCRGQGEACSECADTCCSGQFTTERKLLTEQCNCTFLWCCSVRCDVCEVPSNRTTCL